ncbi:MAG: NAD(P)-dependent alcohol dehydrogenase [Lewinella sp.]|nr:NAD(P)-dependent alcohol dehydrogenase [Lewinella sp.]
MNTMKMKAIVMTAYGAPQVLQLQQVARPTAQAGEVQVRVHAATATAADTMMRTGRPYFGRLFTGLLKPKHPIPGTGFAGVVEAVGEQVSHFQIGDRVFGETKLGFSANAEYVTVPETAVILPMPEGMTFAEACTFTDGPLTSINFLREIGELKAGQHVLINGASGSLGTAAVQLAKFYGAEVTGVCSTRNVGLVKSLGADHVIDYTLHDFTRNENTYDLIYDTVGKSSFQQSKPALKATGKYISPVLDVSLLWQMIRTSRSSGKKAMFSATGLLTEAQLRPMMAELADIYRAGRLTPVIDRQYPLEKVAEAHQYVDTGRKKGNVVIQVRA